MNYSKISTMIHKWFWYTFVPFMFLTVVAFSIGISVSWNSKKLQKQKSGREEKQITFEKNKNSDLTTKLMLLKKYLRPLKLKTQFLRKTGLPTLDLDTISSSEQETIAKLEKKLQVWTHNDIENHYLIKCWNDLQKKEADEQIRLQKWMKMKRFACNRFQIK